MSTLSPVYSVNHLPGPYPIDFPALPGWADVWRSALRALHLWLSTRARATGAGFASAIGRLGSLLGPYAVGVILPRTGQNGVFALGAGTFLIAALSVLLLGVETRGKTLEEISA